MKQKYLNLLLLVVAIGLAWAIVRDQRKDEAKVAEAIAPKPPLTTLNANDIRRIALRNIGSPDITLEKVAAGWMITAPVQIAADLVQIGNITALLSAETRGMVDAAKVKRADLGLDPPRTRVTLDDTLLAIGEIEPLAQTRYVEVNPGSAAPSIQLVDDFAPAATDGDFTDLVNKALLPFDAEIVRLVLPGLTITRVLTSSTPLWTVTPARADATSDALQKMVDGWKRARASFTSPADTAARTAAAAGQTAAVTLADGSTLRFRIIDDPDGRSLERSDVPVRYQLLPADATLMFEVPVLKASPAGAEADGESPPATAIDPAQPQPQPEP